jgi:hypothetical protein
LGRIGKLSKK